ncbi:25S rRNA (uridine-N(3))-methyltransferase BMT5-like [Dillenia turbinata]|uniref:25S rRNA (Uridine-N(3))-methyltransferase BMT5-like n=1 Tax=Dillenia turbinata TaxID=194707 RepID=A0AAN8W6J9_9MAGN
MELDAQEKNERKVEFVTENEVAIVADEEKNGKTVESFSGEVNKNHVRFSADEEKEREVELNFEEGNKYIVELPVELENVTKNVSAGEEGKIDANLDPEVEDGSTTDKETRSEVEVVGADKGNGSGEEENKCNIKLVTEENQVLDTFSAAELISKVELSAKNENESKSKLVADEKSESKIKWVKHYNNRHKILLVGEGDFSFAACLARSFSSAANIVATSYDSQELLGIKHPNASGNLCILRELGCTILHQVNAMSMSTHPVLSSTSFDRILAAGCGLKLIEEVSFTKWDYPGYQNKRGDGPRSNQNFPVGQCSTFKFTKCR